MIINIIRKLALLLSISYMAINVNTLKAGRILEPEKEPKSKRKCCPIGISYLSGPGKVMLEKICITKNRSIFQMRLFGLQSVCTNPNGTVLKDQSGRRYPMVSYKGIPHCRNSGFNKTSGKRFYWHFTRLKKGTRSIILSEEEDEVTRGLTFWAWRNVNLSHCKFP